MNIPQPLDFPGLCQEHALSAPPLVGVKTEVGAGDSCQ